MVNATHPGDFFCSLFNIVADHEAAVAGRSPPAAA